MKENEKYFYKFCYIDGTHDWFEMNENSLTTSLIRGENNRIELKGTIINMDNVIKVVTETQSQRDEEERLVEKQQKENFEALKNFKF